MPPPAVTNAERAAVDDGVATKKRKRLLSLAAAIGVLATLAAYLALSGGDLVVHSWVLEHRSSAGVVVAIVITTLGSSGITIPAVLVAAVTLTPGGVRPRLVSTAMLGAVMACAVTCRYGLSVLIARERPPHADWAYHASGYSLPSGHTFDAALAAGLIGSLVARRLGARPVARLAAWVALITYAVAVGLTRVYLGVHWPTDVLGAWVFAALWLAAVVGFMGRARRPTTAADPFDNPLRPPAPE
jgi:undecaprenyl-diphosphatase